GARVGVRDTTSDELDPRLVRAALGVVEGSAEVEASEPAPRNGSAGSAGPRAPVPPPKKRPAGVTQELGPGDLEELRAIAPAKRGAATKPVASGGAAASGGPARRPKRRVREPEPVPLPTDI